MFLESGGKLSKGVMRVSNGLAKFAAESDGAEKHVRHTHEALSMARVRCNGCVWSMVSASI